MEEDRIKWNQKYGETVQDRPAAELVRQYYHLAPPGRALDIACGLGRNSLFLAERDWTVDAVDISEVALERINHPRINTRALDLDHYQIPAPSYSLIVNIRFLDRDLFPEIRRGLEPGGLLIFETFLQESEHVSNTDYKLRPGELSSAFPEFEIILNREKDGIASLVARKPQFRENR